MPFRSTTPDFSHTNPSAMPRQHDPASFLALRDTGLPVIDARSPAEHARGCIPGSLNLPVLDDEEREAVGTRHARSGSEAAVHLGLELIGPKLAAKLALARRLCRGEREVLVHCWRGGMRSNSLAWLLELGGFKVHLLTGGYKAYRNHVRASFAAPIKVLVLGGMTGTGKTDILLELAQLGSQVIDLEGLAHHRGSAFGSIGMDEQPSNEHFEAALYEAWRVLDPSRPVWVEDESSRIGTVALCDAFFERIRSGTLVTVELPVELRIARLVSMYTAEDDTAGLLHGLERIAKRLGSETHRRCSEAVLNGNHKEAVRLLLRYYDKGYTFQQERQNRPLACRITLEADTPEATARILASMEKRLIDR